MRDLERVKLKWLDAAAAATSLAALEAVRVEALGKKGEITQLLKEVAGLPAEARPAEGARRNEVKVAVAAAVEARQAALHESALDAALAADRIDVTLPPGPEPQGRIHPISQTMDEIVAIFGEMGFRVAEGPDIEDDFHNFTALNIPPEHPARQMHDTFYLAGDGAAGGGKLLRTHTSPVQIRAMRAEKPPLRVIAPGRTYRRDSDMTHTPMFHQVEGLAVDATTHMGHLKGCLIEFCRAFFAVPDLKVRFRPSFFPFTEPSAEVDIGCSRQEGQLRIGAGDDWLEILGCGMVHPKVLAMCDVDPRRYQGFAFGMGIERIAMLKYGIPDLRTFFESDLRWLGHYGFSFLDVPSMTAGLAR